jgi:glycosyltransferase involved in cell wall biosynthesis
MTLQTDRPRPPAKNGRPFSFVILWVPMGQAKKILIFSLAYYPRVGGAEVAIKEITDRISDVEFHMVTLRFSRADAIDEKIGNVFVHRVGRGGSSYFDKMLFVPLAALAAAKLHTSEHFDGVWAMMSYMLLPLSMADLRVPYALTLQEGDSEKHMFGRLRIMPVLPFINRGFRNARVVQAISTYLGGWAKERGFVGPLEIIPNGVDLERFEGSPMPHDATVLITTSRLVSKNAIDDIIRALTPLPNVTFKILGTGPEESKLRKLAQKLLVEDRVDFVGHMDHAALPSYLHAADIFVRPSRTEGMGNSFIEAMAAGLPVIATKEGGLADFITPDVAWPVQRDNPQDIAKAVNEILGNPKRTGEVVERAKRLAQKYDWSIVARDMREKVFARLF